MGGKKGREGARAGTYRVSLFCFYVFYALLATLFLLTVGQRIIGQPEKRKIPGGWLGSSAAYRVHLPLLSGGRIRVTGAAAVAFGDFGFFCPP